MPDASSASAGTSSETINETASKADQAVPDKQRRAHPNNRLTAKTVKHAAPGRYADGGGLYLEVDNSGARRWILRTTVAKRRRDIGLGGCSYVTLAEAREKAFQLRKVAKEGGNPIAERDREKRQSTTFEDAARQAHAKLIVGAGKNGKHVAQWISTLETYAFPRIGGTPVHMIEQADVIAVLSLYGQPSLRRLSEFANASGLSSNGHVRKDCSTA